MTEKNKRILIVRLSAIGDVLRVLPALQALKRAYPGAYIGWVVEEKARDILDAHPDVDEVIVFPKERIRRQLMSPTGFRSGLREFAAFIRIIRDRRYDTVLDFHGLFKSGIISYLSGAPERIGFTRAHTKECNFLFNNQRFALDTSRVSRIDRNLTLLRKAGIDIRHALPFVHIPEADRRAVELFFSEARIDRGRPVVVMHPGTSPTTPYKRWEPYRYAVAADKIIENNAAQILFTWAGSEMETVREIVSLMKHRATIAPEAPSLCRLAAIFSRSDVYVGGDTGPMHLAALCGTPVVALFGPTDHVVNEPYSGTPHIIVRKETGCAPCRKYECSKRLCMKDIREENVVRAVGIMLDSFKHARRHPDEGCL